MTIEVVDIKPENGLLSMLLADFYICKSCYIVDRDHARTSANYKCSSCGELPNSSVSFYFPIQVFSLVDLMQEFYHMRPGDNPYSTKGIPYSEDPIIYAESNHKLAVVIFFCTLGEVLLEHFLRQCMLKKRLPREIQQRLFDDNLFMRQRVEKLFPAVTDNKWNYAIKMISSGELEYTETVTFYENVSKVRNKFIHRGHKWAVPKDMPEQSIRHIWPLIKIFVSLHNKYVAGKPTVCS